MLDLSTITTQCLMCVAATERSLQNLLDVNAELQAENRRLEQIINEWQAQPGLTFEQQYLIDIVGQLVAVLKLRPDTLPRGYAEQIRAYDKCNIAEGTNELAS